jgi:hypothetical protein
VSADTATHREVALAAVRQTFAGHRVGAFGVLTLVALAVAEGEDTQTRALSGGVNDHRGVPDAS